MGQNRFLKVFSILFISTTIVVIAVSPFLYSQIREVLYNLNLEKNREQAERLATLISIDIENGQQSEVVLEKIQVMLETTPQSSEHFACIVEDKNKVIAHPKPSDVGKDVTGWVIRNEVEEKTFTQSAGEGVPFGGIQTRLDGSQDISYQVPISIMPWSVCVHTKLDIVDQQTYTILGQIGWIIFPTLLFLLLLCSFFLTKNPVKK